MIVCHDRRAPLNRALGARSPIMDIEHLQLFSQASARALLERTGFARRRACAASPTATRCTTGSSSRRCRGGVKRALVAGARRGPLALAVALAAGRQPRRDRLPSRAERQRARRGA